MSDNNFHVFCADVGSIKNKNFGWYYYSPTKNQGEGGGDIDSFYKALKNVARENKKIALGFEFPTFIYLKSDPIKLLEQRPEDKGKSWSAGAGPFALAAGIAEVCWLFDNLRDSLSGYKIFFDPKAFLAHEEPAILFWEAHVTGKSNGSNNETLNSHISDAKRAVEKFLLEYKQLSPSGDGKVINLLGAFLLWAGLSDDLSLLKERMLVINTTK